MVIEKILLTPRSAGALAVVETSILDDERMILVPWSSIQVQTKENDPETIIYALDANDAKLSSAPVYTAEKSAFEDELQRAGEYWSVIKHETKDVAKDVKDGAKKAYEKTKDTIKDAVEEIREEF